MSIQGKITSYQIKTLAWDLLTFDRLLTGPVVHLIYWAGLGLIGLMGFGLVGGAIGLALRDGTVTGGVNPLLDFPNGGKITSANVGDYTAQWAG